MRVEMNITGEKPKDGIRSAGWRAVRAGTNAITTGTHTCPEGARVGEDIEVGAGVATGMAGGTTIGIGMSEEGTGVGAGVGRGGTIRPSRSARSGKGVIRKTGSTSGGDIVEVMFAENRMRKIVRVHTFL
jgi:hypothetical protein